MIALYELINLLPASVALSLSNKENELLHFLRKEKNLSKEEAALQFLGTSKRNRYFNNLKNKLKHEILGYIIVNPSTWVDNEYKAKLDFCYKKFTCYRLLLASGNTAAGIEIAKKLLPKLEEAEIYCLAHATAIDLQVYYSTIGLKSNSQNKYTRIVEEQLKLVQAESTIRSRYSKVTSICNGRNSYTPKMVEELIQICTLVEPYLSYKSAYLNRFIYNIIIARYAVEYDYKNMLAICDKAIRSFASKKGNHRLLQFAFLQKKIVAQTALGQLRSAKEIAKRASKMVTIGKFNWHLALLRRAIVCLHTGDYQETYEIYKEHAKYKCDYSTLKEYWIILKGYIYFLINNGRIKQYDEERFNIGKFVNETPIYAKDKTGNNINIITIQILLHLQRDQFGKIIDRIESLKAYAQSYTRDPEMVRANLFINMIVKMEKSQFHRVATERNTKRLFDRLKENPIRPKLNLAIEIIPYEALWDFVLEMLDNKFRATTRKKISI